MTEFLKMKALFYSIQKFEVAYYLNTKSDGEIKMISESLNAQTAILAKGFEIISIFTNDDASAEIIDLLYTLGVKHITIRAAGFDNVAIKRADEIGINVANVPAYSPHAIAEHTIGMILTLNRKYILADKQVKAHDFTIDKLIGFNLYKKKIGIIGTGRIGAIVTKILHGFGCEIYGYDVNPNNELKELYKIKYTTLENLCAQSDIITLHTPLNERTRYLINEKLIKQMKPNIMIINTSRGSVVKTADIIQYLENGQIGYFGMDVYEKEKGIYFYNHQYQSLQDSNLLKLIKMENVLITSHQAFATEEALENIASTTKFNIKCFDKNVYCKNELTKLETKENLISK